MNKRIEELRFQAWDYVASCDDQYSKSATDLFEEKFAELIVKECADRCEMSPYPHPNYSVSIKKHFGVQE